MTNPTPIDITNIPELRHLVEEMRASKQPRLLKQDRESVALLMPLGTTLKHQQPAAQMEAYQRVLRSPNQTRTRKQFEAFLETVPVLPFSPSIAKRCAQLRETLH